jgi:hypothetical protein
LIAVLAKTVRMEPPSLREQRADVSPEVCVLVERLLAKSPERRPVGAAALLTELDALALPVATVGVDGGRTQEVISRHERRFLTLVLVGSPSVGGAKEGVIEEELLSRLVESHGGSVTRLADGSWIVAVTGGREATDNAVRGAQCALALRELLVDTPIAMVVGRGEFMKGVPVGTLIDRGAKLLERAGLGTVAGPVRLDENAGHLLELRFDIDADATGQVLRKERDFETQRTLLGHTTTCVGRDREMETLRALLDECVSGSVARAVLVTGDPGVGKSRVRYEFLKHTRERYPGVEIWMGRGDTMRGGSPFETVALLVRHAARLSEGESLIVRQFKLRKRVAMSGFTGADLVRVTEFLGELIGVTFPDGGSVQLREARSDPRLMGNQKQRAFEDWLNAECAMRPVMMVLEDLHWCSPPHDRRFTTCSRSCGDSAASRTFSCCPCRARRACN